MAWIEAYHLEGGSKRYSVRYRKPDRSLGRRSGFRTKRDAELFASTVELSKARGDYVDAAAGRVTVGELGPEWLEAKRVLKPSSYRPLESAWRIYVEPAWGRRPLSSIRTSEVQAWVTKLSTGDPQATPPVEPKSATTVIRAYGVLASILDAAVKDRRITVNPARGVEDLPRKRRKAHVYLSHELVHSIAEHSKYPELVLVLSYCGLRWGEAVALRVGDVDMLGRRLHVHRNAVEVGGVIHEGTPKSHKARSVPVPAFLLNRLAQLMDGRGPDDLLFPGPGGGYLRSARVHKDNHSWFAAALDAAGAPRVTPHDLRHTAAAFAVSAGANVKAVQRMLGHASASMTLDVYADLFDEDLNAVAVALDDVVSQTVAPVLRLKASSGE